MKVIFSNSQVKNIGNNYEHFSMGGILGQATWSEDVNRLTYAQTS
jgi:hypothetical protein